MATRAEELQARYSGFTVVDEAEQDRPAPSMSNYEDPDYRDPRLEELRKRYNGYTVENTTAEVTADDDPTWGDYGRMIMAGGAQVGS
jgi:hypothetical protein